VSTVGTMPPAGEPAAERAPEASASRLQQRLEWERALLAAQPRSGHEPDPGAPRAPEAAAASSPAAPRAEPPARTAAAARADTPAAARAGIPAGAPGEPSAALATALPARAPAPPPPSAAGERLGREPAAPRVAAPPRPARAAPAWPGGSAAEPAAFGVYRDEDEVRLWLRDLRIGRDAGSRLVEGLRRVLERLGLRLRSFTLNGARLAGDEPAATAARRESRPPDAERVLDTFY